MQALPDWTGEGAIVGYEGGSQAVRWLWDRLRDVSVPVAGFWLQDWSGVRTDSFGTRVEWNWELSEKHYPGWDLLLEELAGSGIKVLTYINPYLAATTVPGTQTNLFQEASAQGFLVKNSRGDPYIQTSGSPGFTFGTIDLTNPAAAAWYEQVIRCNMLRVGVGCGAGEGMGPAGGSNLSQFGWMSDFGEYIPMDAKLHAGAAEAVHNLFPVLWAETNQRAVRSAGMEGQVAFFSRSSGARSPGSSALFWLGDQLVTTDKFDGLQSAMLGMLSGGVCGLAMTHSDIGGYTMMDSAFMNPHVHVSYTRTKKTLFRWLEMSAFSDAIFRTHPGNLPNKSAQVYSDHESLQQFGKFARIHSALAVYRRSLMREATRRGSPLSRHPWLHYFEDPVAANLTTQFMMGAEIMVAPVFGDNVSAVEAYLPGTQERWYHWRNANVAFHGGEWYSVNAPVGQPAVFARQGFAQTDVWKQVAEILRDTVASG
eukprot:TRINITY_DN8806_c0_g1_i2.p1 TRINITY_DN8806_c0_g1~~TRINITY_DN8806_c0_g1_i2.p1  ORF type:complete len:482 (+),score=97.42 TRINITY_DN8806_c0_g1_i2:900-2345(+)